MPYSQRRGRTQPGLEKRLGPGLQWIYSPRGMCLACPGSGQRRGRGQERCGPEWRTGRIMHQAETVPGQGGVKPGDNLSPCRTLPGRKEGPGQGDAWVLPAGEGCLRTRLFKDSLVVGAGCLQFLSLGRGAGYGGGGAGRPRYQGIPAPDTRVAVCPSCASYPHLAMGPQALLQPDRTGARVPGL